MDNNSHSERPRSRVRMLIKKFSNPNLETPFSSFEEPAESPEDARSQPLGDQNIRNLDDTDVLSSLRDYESNHDEDYVDDGVDTGKLMAEVEVKERSMKLGYHHNDYTKYDTTKLLSLAAIRQSRALDEKMLDFTEKNTRTNDDESEEISSFHEEDLERLNINESSTPIYHHRQEIENDRDIEAPQDITDIFNKRSPAQPVLSMVIYVDSRTNRTVPSSYLEKKLLPFKEKDFNCKFTFISKLNSAPPANPYGENVTMKRLFVPTPDDYVFYREVCDLVERILKSFNFQKFKELPQVFYNYCKILMESGLNPSQDLLVTYIITFLKDFKDNNVKRLPLKLKLIARIFALRNLKTENFYHSDEIIDSGDDLSYDNDVVSRDELINKRLFSRYQLSNNWLLDDEFSFDEFNNCNFNLLISRAIRYSIFLYWQRRKQLKKVFLNTWNVRFELKKREKRLTANWEKFLVKKVFVNKFYKPYLKLVKLEKVAARCAEKSLKKKCLSAWKTKLLNINALNKVAQDHYLGKFFNYMVSKHKLLGMNVQKAIGIDENSLKTYHLKTWRLKTSLAGGLNRIKALHDEACIKNVFSKWRNKSEKIKTMENDGQILTTAIFCAPLLFLWKEKALIRTSQFTSLTEKITTRIKVRYFKNWITLTRINLQKYEFEKNQKIIMKKFIFEAFFIKNHALKTLENDFQRTKNIEILANYFISWKNITMINLKATKFNVQRLKAKYMHQLNKSYELLMVENYYNYKLLQRSFVAWEREAVYHQRLRQFELMVLKKFFMIWKESTQELLVIYKNSERVHDYFLKFRMIKNWYNKHIYWMDQDHNADIIFMKNKCLNNFIGGYRRNIESFKNKEEFILEKRDVNLKKRFLQTWKIRIFELRQEKLQNYYQDFVSKKNQGMTEKIFGIWKSRKDHIAELEKNANEMVLRKHLLKIVKRYIEIDDWALFAINYHNRSILNRCFERLIEVSNKNYDLRITLETHVNNQNFKILEKVFNNWSMRLMKLKQMQQSLKLFREKWDKAKSKNVLLIWQQKYHDRATLIEQYRQLDRTSNILSSNNSQVINDSILRRVSPIKSFNQRMGILPNNNTKSEYSFMDDGDHSNDASDLMEDLPQSPSMEKQKRIHTSSSFKNLYGGGASSKNEKLDIPTIKNDQAILFSSTPFSNKMRFTSPTKFDRRPDYDIRTPSASRIINMSQVFNKDVPILNQAGSSITKSNVIKNERLKSLKRYYNSSTKR